MILCVSRVIPSGRDRQRHGFPCPVLPALISVSHGQGGEASERQGETIKLEELKHMQRFLGSEIQACIYTFMYFTV